VPELTLYRAVGNLNRVALGDLATSEYFTAEVAHDGAIILTPVNIVGSATKRTPDAAEQADPDDEPNEQVDPFS
jgi:hypothetical protein